MTYNSDEGTAKKTVLKMLKTELENPSCIGLIINESAAHWTAVVKYSEECKRSKKRTHLYKYADSLTCGSKAAKECYTISQIAIKLRGFDLQAGIFIYTKDDGTSYKSNAVLNRDTMNGGNRSKKITMKRKNNRSNKTRK
jgi:hypothetical protein